jgi:hypothetical protein
MLQQLIQERFAVRLSVSQLNRVRASLGLTYRPVPREKNATSPKWSEPDWYEGAGGLLLLAAANETTLITHLCEALPSEPPSARPPLASSSADLCQRLACTLLFMSVVGAQRTWDLRSYTADGLALLTGRKRAYGYHYTETFLSQVAKASGAVRWADALAHWTTYLWYSSEEPSASKTALTCYIDGHRKPVYTDACIPRGLVGRNNPDIPETRAVEEHQ